ncbi:hypothetical protein YC2023_075451 [Brassica napus]
MADEGVFELGIFRFNPSQLCHMGCQHNNSLSSSRPIARYNIEAAYGIRGSIIFFDLLGP